MNSGSITAHKTLVVVTEVTELCKTCSRRVRRAAGAEIPTVTQRDVGGGVRLLPFGVILG